MIATMTFAAPQPLGDGRVMRRPTFTTRSTLPLSAACLVANGVRETLARLLAADVETELIEPSIPSAAERAVLLEAATVFRVRGRLCDGFVIVRPVDARRIVCLAFGESERSEHDPLSDIERATLDRVVSAMIPLCNALCGTLGPVARESSARASCDVVTYFEVRTAGTARVAIGFALASDPPEAIGERITLDDLADVELAGTVRFATGSLGVPAFSRLAVGATIAFDTPLDARGILLVGDTAVARGTCGVAAGRNVMIVDAEAAAVAALRGAA
ncbi:MAG: hypothetical protein NVS4B5_20820 [Vulcanimicrobiaceae bacterium]